MHSLEEKKSIKTNGLDASDLLDGIEYGFEPGNRNSGMASIAGLFHSRNIDRTFIKSFLMAINKNNEVPLSEREINTIIESITRYPVTQEYQETKVKDISTIQDAAEEWYKIIKSSGYTSFGERFPHINQRMKICIPGDVIAIVANSGVGKSTIGLEFGNNEAKSRDMYSLMASLEMSRAGLFFRVATIESLKHVNNHVPSEQVVKDLLEEEELKQRVIKEWRNLLIVDRGSVTLDKIAEYYHLAQEEYKGKISNLIIDYAQNIQGAEEIEYAMRMARQLKTMAKELNTKVFVLMQCNKTMPNDYTQVQKNHIEGAGAYFQACDYIMGFWRSRDIKNRLHGCFIKDRWGSADFTFDLVRDGLKYHSEDYLEDKTINDMYAL
jgi:replicative DNA helicase